MRRVVRLPDLESVLDATHHDSYARNTARAGTPVFGWRSSAAVAWVGVDAEDRTPLLSVLGTPQEAAGLLAEVLNRVPRELPVTMPVDAYAHLPPGVRIERRYHWRFRTMSHPPILDARIKIGTLPGEGDARIAALLDDVGGLSSARPGDPAVLRWAVAEEGERVLACAADTSGAPGVGHMGAVAVHPTARRRGLGTAVVAWLTKDLLLHGRDVVVVGVFVDEPAAQRLYDHVGFRTVHEFFTGPQRRPGPPANAAQSEPSQPPANT